MQTRKPENPREEAILEKVNELSEALGGWDMEDAYNVVLNMMGLLFEQMEENQRSLALMHTNRIMMRWSLGDEAMDNLEAELEIAMQDICGEKPTIQ